MTVNERFKKVRLKLDFTQFELAEKLDDNSQSITDIESGRKKVGLELMYKLHIRMAINLNWLICGTGQMKLEEYNIASEPQATYHKTDETKELAIQTLQELNLMLKEKNADLQKRLDDCLKNGVRKPFNSTC